MNPFFSKILVDIARKRLEAKHIDKPVSKKQIVPLVRKFQVEISHAIKEYIYIAIGVFSAGFGLKGFLLMAVLQVFPDCYKMLLRSI